jgi:hypothetical protein
VAAETATLLEILNKTAEWFKAKGIENHRLDAQLLLGHVLGMKRMDLYMNFDRPLSEDEIGRFRELVKRRGAREPLQHLLGETPFRELALKVDKRALIPRQETELIVDLVRKSLAPGRQSRVLDVGVGAGPIFLSIAKEIPNAIAYGCDVSRARARERGPQRPFRRQPVPRRPLLRGTFRVTLRLHRVQSALRRGEREAFPAARGARLRSRPRPVRRPRRLGVPRAFYP